MLEGRARDGKVFVREKLAKTSRAVTSREAEPLVRRHRRRRCRGPRGADMLRREGYANPVTMISSDQDAPVDRPNLSKDYLAGEAQDDWIPMWPPELYEERHVELVLGTRVASIDPAARTISLENGTRREYGRCCSRRAPIPCACPFPATTRTRFSTCAPSRTAGRSLNGTKGASRVVVVGASFIGLEVAASLRAREINVDVVAPDAVPLERVMGGEVGRFVRRLHEAHGVVFHLGQTVASVDGRTVA